MQYRGGFEQICGFVAIDGLSYVLVLIVKLLPRLAQNMLLIACLTAIKPVTSGTNDLH